MSRRDFAAVFVVIAHIVLVWAEPVPSGNEHDYLAFLRVFWDRRFLANDWTFSTTLPDRWTFDAVFGSFALFLPLSVVGWVGRAACWILGTRVLLRVARQLAIPLPWAAAAISAWIITGQSLVGKEWMLGTFEAKVVAYVFWLYALELLLSDRFAPAAACGGLAVTIHPAVGTLASGALAGAAIAVYGLRREFIRPAVIGVVCAAPGFLQATAMIGGSQAGSDADWEYLAKGLLEGVLDLPTFSRQLVVLQLAFAAIAILWGLSRHATRGFRLLAWTLAILLLPVTVGVIAHLTHVYRLLFLTPFRLFPVLGLLTSYFALAAALAMVAQHSRTGRIATLLVAACAALVLLPAYRTAFGRLVASWCRPADDIDAAFRWVASSAPRGAVVVAPPWRQDSTLRLQRAQIVHWSIPRYDRLGEWRRRAEILVGGMPADSAGRDPLSAEKTRRAHYDALSPDALRQLRHEYGATYAVAERDYPFRVRFAQGLARVYEIPQ